MTITSTPKGMKTSPAHHHLHHHIHSSGIAGLFFCCCSGGRKMFCPSLSQGCNTGWGALRHNTSDVTESWSIYTGANAKENRRILDPAAAMRALVILVVVSCCSAHLVPYTAPWVLPSAKLVPSTLVDTEGKVVALHTPYIHSYTNPLVTPYAYPYATPYAHPYGYVVKPGLKATEFPYIWQASEIEAEAKPETEAEVTPAVEEARRRRRDVEAVKVPLPYIQAVPTVAKTTFETKQYEPVDAATPADTTKLTLTTKEHEVSVPAVKYVQPVVQYKPITYRVPSHVPLTYSLPYHSYYPNFPAFPYFAHATPVVKLDE